MISRKRFFSAGHIQASAFHASHELAEQALHCLELVCELSEERFPCQFKGGNSLLLILDHPQRFSIDVDIATDRPAVEIEEVLTRIVKRFGVFTRWEGRRHKTKPWIRLASYYVYYKSIINGDCEAAVMLDAQLRLSPYRCEKKRIACDNLFYSEAEIEVPLPGSIIGDKLLTLGPNTLGIPVGKGKAAQRLKHAFDVSRLLDMRPPLAEIRESFRNCLAFENDLQGKALSADAVLCDTLASCRSIVGYNEPPVVSGSATVLEEHCMGYAPFAAHLFSSGYSWADLQIDMARAACCIAAAATDLVSQEQFTRAFSAPLCGAANKGQSNKPLLQSYWDYVDEWTGEGGASLEGKGVKT